MSKRTSKRVDIRYDDGRATAIRAIHDSPPQRAIKPGFHRYTIKVRDLRGFGAHRYEAWVDRGGFRSVVWSRASTFAPCGSVECASPLDGAVGKTAAEAVSRARLYARAWVRMQLARDMTAELESWRNGTWERDFPPFESPLARGGSDV